VAGTTGAKNGVTVSGGVIGGDVISSTGTIALSGNTKVYGGAKAASTISVQNPATVYGTQSPNTAGIGNPPSQTYPTYTYAAADWSAGNAPVISGVSYTNPVAKSDCTSALNAITNWTSGDLYIRLTGCPTLTISSSKSIPGNLGIITDGSIQMSTPAKIYNGDASGTSHTVYMFTGMTTPASCGNFSAQSNTGFGSNLKEIVYTPQACSATISSNSFNGVGQIFSGTISFNSNMTFTYSPTSLPGQYADDYSGWLIDVVYKREISV
jgi:hypothetical protein